MLLQQSVKYDDLLDASDAILEGVGVAASLRAVDDLHLAKRVCTFFGQGLDVCLDCVLFDWLKLIEERHDDVWDQDHEEEHDDGQEDAGPNVELLTSGVYDPEEPIEQWNAKDELDEEREHPILEPAAQCLFVEAVRFFDHELLYQAEGPSQHNGEHLKEGKNQQGLVEVKKYRAGLAVCTQSHLRAPGSGVRPDLCWVAQSPDGQLKNDVDPASHQAELLLGPGILPAFLKVLLIDIFLYATWSLRNVRGPQLPGIKVEVQQVEYH